MTVRSTRQTTAVPPFALALSLSTLALAGCTARSDAETEPRVRNEAVDAVSAGAARQSDQAVRP